MTALFQAAYVGVVTGIAVGVLIAVRTGNRPAVANAAGALVVALLPALVEAWFGATTKVGRHGTGVMGTDSIDEFEASVDRTVDSCRRATAETLEVALDEVVSEPAVGVPLPFEGVSLEGTTITVDPSVEELRAAATGVTPAGMGIANYGTVTVQSREAGDELVSLYPRRHVAVVAASDVVADMTEAFERLEAAFEAGATGRVLATGPSATADMGSLVEGVHGPETVHVVVLEDR